jgi:predicted nucleic acid-binding protein
VIFADIPAGAAVFLDANTLIYHFSGHPKYGRACTELLERIERLDLEGITSAHTLADVAHRLMTIEAMNNLGWPAAGLAARLKRNYSEIPKLSLFQDAVAKVPQLGVQVLPVNYSLIREATDLSRQFELLTGDALVVAVMRSRGLIHLASADDDFDRVSILTRYSPF